MTKLGISLMVLMGMAFLVLGVIKALKVVSLVKKKKNWRILIVLMGFFLIGYFLFLLSLNLGKNIHLEILIGLIFFFGSVFVYITMTVSANTVEDVLRVDKLELMTITDSLTGLYNRRYIESRGETEVKRSLRYGHVLSLLMIDIDHFKTINDTYGHQMGDEVLKRIGQTLKSQTRESDMAARYGGEEFLLIYPETKIPSARVAAERMRLAIKDLKIPLPGESPDRAEEDQNGSWIGITVSIGISGLIGDDKQDFKTLLKRADRALYRAKAEGRDRIVIDT